MSHMKNEAQQAAISAHGKKDLQYALGFTIHGRPQIYSGTQKCLKYVGKWHSCSVATFLTHFFPSLKLLNS